MRKRKFNFQAKEAGVALNVKIVPRASRNEIVGLHSDGVIKVRVKAPPVEGAANDALVDLLADKLKIKPRDIEIVVGFTSARKLLTISGLTAEQVDQRIGFNTGAR